MALEVTVIKQQLQSLVAQRDQAAQTFQQCVGAISILQEQLKFILEKEMAEQQAAKEAEKNMAVMDSLPCDEVKEEQGEAA